MAKVKDYFNIMGHNVAESGTQDERFYEHFKILIDNLDLELVELTYALDSHETEIIKSLIQEYIQLKLTKK